MSRVILRVILPNFATFGLPLLSSLLVANAVAHRSLIHRIARGVDEGTSALRVVGDWPDFIYLELICLLFILQILLLCTAAYAFCVASIYCTGGGLRAAHPPPNQLWLEEDITLSLRLLGWATAAYVAVVGQLACVVSVSVLEDAVFYGTVRRSWELLAGKFWTVATLLLTLDGCIIAVLKAFPVLMLDDALGLGLGFRLAAGTAMAVALWAVLHVTLVAQPVVYMVCKSNHQVVVDMTHLN
ncbi:hypothetical protein ACQ4PT_046839 [Festuca glaucescens]